MRQILKVEAKVRKQSRNKNSGIVHLESVNLKKFVGKKAIVKVFVR